MKPYPIFLVQLADRHTVVIGGSHEAEGKVEGLLNCDATITVISPTLTPTLHGQAQEGAFTWLQRPYQTGDLAGAFLVISERFDPETNARIWDEGERVGALVNVMDDIPRCNFVAGSVVRQGPLTISISTSGAAPALESVPGTAPCAGTGWVPCVALHQRACMVTAHGPRAPGVPGNSTRPSLKPIPVPASGAPGERLGLRVQGQGLGALEVHQPQVWLRSFVHVNGHVHARTHADIHACGYMLVHVWMCGYINQSVHPATSLATPHSNLDETMFLVNRCVRIGVELESDPFD